MLGAHAYWSMVYAHALGQRLFDSPMGLGRGVRLDRCPPELEVTVEGFEEPTQKPSLCLIRHACNRTAAGGFSFRSVVVHLCKTRSSQVCNGVNQIGPGGCSLVRIEGQVHRLLLG